MDKILTIFDPLPLGGQIWTILQPFSYVEMDIPPPYLVHVVIERPLTFNQYFLAK